MSDLRIVVSTDLVQQLEAQKIPRAMIRKAVTDNVIQTLQELAKNAPARKPKSGETANEYFRRIMLEQTGSKPPPLDEPFLKNGMTRSEYLAMSDGQEKALWDKWHEEEWKKIDKEYGEGIDVRFKGSARQKRSAKNVKSAREKRAKYRVKPRRTKRA